MTTVQVSKEEMLSRVARFEDLKPSKQAYVDSLLPGNERENIRVLGRGVSDDPSMSPAITGDFDFSIGLNKAGPGKGASLHIHQTEEIFFPLSGEWALFWGDNGENEIILRPWDIVSIPPGCYRGFRNVSNQEAYLLGMVNKKDPGRVTWPPETLARAREAGLIDERGELVQKS